MQSADAQRDVRPVCVGGLQGQLVSGSLWLVSANAATWGLFSPAWSRSSRGGSCCAGRRGRAEPQVLDPVGNVTGLMAPRT